MMFPPLFATPFQLIPFPNNSFFILQLLATELSFFAENHPYELFIKCMTSLRSFYCLFYTSLSKLTLLASVGQSMRPYSQRPFLCYVLEQQQLIYRPSVYYFCFSHAYGCAFINVAVQLTIHLLKTGDLLEVSIIAPWVTTLVKFLRYVTGLLFLVIYPVISKIVYVCKDFLFSCVADLVL